jgi:hypothetical protein
VIVGATLRWDGRLATASWPLLNLTIAADELTLNLRWRWTKRMPPFSYLVAQLNDDGGSICWKSPVSEVTGIQISERSRSVLITTNFRDCCIGIPFFVPRRHRRWETVLAGLQTLNAPIGFVSGTFLAQRSMK